MPDFFESSTLIALIPRMRWFWAEFCLMGILATCGCQTITQTPQAGFEHRISRDQIILHSDSSFDAESRLIKELIDQREWLTATLRLSATDVPIHVYLFDDEGSYSDHVEARYPGFASRRAIFVNDGDQLAVYAYRGEHVADDLRHEVSHGYLHAAIPQLPFWLDEGLAEFFEVGESKQGMNRHHVHLLQQLKISQDWQPDLRKLEMLQSPENMTQVQYAEAWVWVHFLLKSEHDMSNVLIDYLADLRQGGAGAMLSTQVHNRLARPELSLMEHLENL